MQISSPEPAGARRPYVKLNEVGDSVVISIGHVDRSIEERDYETNEVKRWDDGNPVTQTRIVGIVHAVEGSAVGRMGGEEVALEPGMEVAIFVSGGKQGNQGRYKDAERDAGGVELADIFRYRFDRTEPASNPRYNDRKIHTSDIRRAKPEEKQKYTDACEEIWNGFQNTPTVSSPEPAMSAAAVAEHFSEDPF